MDQLSSGDALLHILLRDHETAKLAEYAELLQQFNQRVYPYVVNGEGTAKETLDALTADWQATFKKYGRM